MSSSINFFGVSLDSKVTFINHLSRVYRQCFIQLRKKVYSIPMFLGENQRKQLAAFVVLSSLDFCIVTYLQLSKKLIRKLQKTT